MSYILEALKKSQRERNLGQVPTLERLPMLESAEPQRIPYWGLAAVILAGLAVLIALYAAFREPLPRKPALQVSPFQVHPAAPEKLPAEPAQPIPPKPVPRQEPPPPMAEKAPEGTTWEEAFPPSVESKLQVPEDLRAEIEAFKRRFSPESEVSEAPPPPEARQLPETIRARLPAFLMTVHRYDTDPAERFVLINGRKLREGQRTRTGIQVLQILPDGALLSYEGYRFFQHR